MYFELTNVQREYFGLDPVQSTWEKVSFAGDAHRPESILYFESDVIKRHIVSTDQQYKEIQYDAATQYRRLLLPETTRSKPQKLSAASLERKRALGVYLGIDQGHLIVGNYSTQTTFYSSRWDHVTPYAENIATQVTKFIEESPLGHLEEINYFKKASRRNVKFRAGDYFCFKISRTHYGFGRVLLDVHEIKKRNLIADGHGLRIIMGRPVIVQLFACTSTSPSVDLAWLVGQPVLPSDVMMDNLLFYGEYDIIGNRALVDHEFDFPISYGASMSRGPTVFLQWGLIHLELPKQRFSKFITEPSGDAGNPYGFYSIGFRPHYGAIDVHLTAANGGLFDFTRSTTFYAKWDLRSPRNSSVRAEIFEAFGLRAEDNYVDSSRRTGTPLPSETISRMY